MLVLIVVFVVFRVVYRFFTLSVSISARFAFGQIVKHFRFFGNLTAQIRTHDRKALGLFTLCLAKQAFNSCQFFIAIQRLSNVANVTT